MSNTYAKPSASEMRVRRSITLQDLEWLGPTKVVLASELPEVIDPISVVVPITMVPTKQSDSPSISSPGRLPTGMADLLH